MKNILVDPEDEHLLNKYQWYVSNTGYVVSDQRRSRNKNPTGEILLLHRVIMNPDKSKVVDHINGNPLDNRRSNLRIATPAENCWNTKKHKDNKSGHKGVSKIRHKWRAVIMVNGITRSLYFYSKEEAIEAYNKMAKEFHKEFSKAQ
jgi:hypothetical protein